MIRVCARSSWPVLFLALAFSVGPARADDPATAEAIDPGVPARPSSSTATSGAIEPASSAHVAVSFGTAWPVAAGYVFGRHVLGLSPVLLLGAIIYVGVFGTIFPFVLYYVGINYIRSTRAAITADGFNSGPPRCGGPG